jgi:hypothetical protein
LCEAQRVSLYTGLIHGACTAVMCAVVFTCRWYHVLCACDSCRAHGRGPTPYFSPSSTHASVPTALLPCWHCMTSLPRATPEFGMRSFYTPSNMTCENIGHLQVSRGLHKWRECRPCLSTTRSDSPMDGVRQSIPARKRHPLAFMFTIYKKY